MRMLSGLILILIASPTAPAAARGLRMSQTDVCAVRPDLCDGASATERAARPARARAAGTTGRLDAQSMSLASVVRSTPKSNGTARAPQRRVASVIEQAAAGARRTRALTCRPARVAVTEANASLAECGAASATTGGRSIASVGETEAAAVHTAAVNFNAYLHQNAANPALSRKISGYQTAFKDTAKPATLDLRGSGDDSGVRETAANAGVTTAAPAGNQ